MFHKNKTKPDGHQRYCKICRKKYDNEWYNNGGKEIIRNSNSKRNKRLRKKVNDYKKDKKCKACGDSRYWVLDLHHMDPNHKEFSISDMIRQGFSEAKLEIELEKCEVLCSNCHRELHYFENLNRTSTT